MTAKHARDRCMMELILAFLAYECAAGSLPQDAPGAP